MTDDLAPTPAELEAAATLEAYHALFTSEAGLRVLLDLERRFWYGKTTAIRPAPGQPIDQAATLINEGSRMPVLHIKAQVAKAKLGTPERQTHAVSSAAEGEL